MLALLLMTAQVAMGQTVASCRAGNDPEKGVWSLEQAARDRPAAGGETSPDCSIVEQPENDRRPDGERAGEWTAAIGAARSVNLYESTAGRSYGVVTVGGAKELTRELKWGPIRGRFAWGVEATPLFAQFEPSTIYGAGFAPVIWRWNFPPRPRWSVFAELSMGGLWTSDPIPERTGNLNFTAHWGGGIRFKPRGGHAILVAYRFQHFSNGNQLGSNPGVNSHVVLAGWSYREASALRRTTGVTSRNFPVSTKPTASPGNALDRRGTSALIQRGCWRRHN